MSAPAFAPPSPKDEGNKHFQAKRYDEAIRCYTKGCGVGQDAAQAIVCRSNRGLAYAFVKDDSRAKDDFLFVIQQLSPHPSAATREDKILLAKNHFRLGQLLEREHANMSVVTAEEAGLSRAAHHFGTSVSLFVEVSTPPDDLTFKWVTFVSVGLGSDAASVAPCWLLSYPHPFAPPRTSLPVLTMITQTSQRSVRKSPPHHFRQRAPRRWRRGYCRGRGGGQLHTGGRERRRRCFNLCC